MNEQYYEKLLNIKTSGEQKNFNESIHYNRYEPTAYSALEVLSKNYTLTEVDSIIDFGCGKGRLNFYINHFFQATVTGIEMNSFFYKEALENKKAYLKNHKKKIDNINFLNCFAEEYNINPSNNKFYFFNPFSVQIFTKVVKKIIISVEKSERPVDIILYYPSEDYIYFLENNTSFRLFDEIRLPSLYDKDHRQTFLVYRLDYGNNTTY